MHVGGKHATVVVVVRMVKLYFLCEVILTFGVKQRKRGGSLRDVGRRSPANSKVD
jgi:hypothetical protein